MNKKKALGTDPLGWIKETVSIEEREIVSEKEISEEKLKKETKIPKFKTFEVKLSILLKKEHLDYLNRLEREIMSNRSQGRKKERITKNSVIRSLVDILSRVRLDTEEIGDENILKERIQDAFKI